MIPFLLIIIFLSKAVITPFVIAFFLSYALNPAVAFLQKKGASRDIAILTIYFVTFVGLVLILEFIIPKLIKDFISLGRDLPKLIKKIEALENQVTLFFRNQNLPVDLKAVLSILLTRIEGVFRDWVISLPTTIAGFFSKSLTLIFVPLIAYYISRDYPRLKKKLYCWLLNNVGVLWTETLLKIDRIFRLYIRGQLLNAVIMGSLIGIGLSLMGIEGAIFLGMFAGVVNLIPYFGPILGALPPILLAVFQSSWLVVYIILLFIVVNQIETLILTPRIIGRNIGLHPIMVFYLVLFGGSNFGLPGMILAIPLGAILLIIIKSLYQISYGIVKK